MCLAAACEVPLGSRDWPLPKIVASALVLSLSLLSRVDGGGRITARISIAVRIDLSCWHREARVTLSPSTSTSPREKKSLAVSSFPKNIGRWWLVRFSIENPRSFQRAESQCHFWTSIEHFSIVVVGGIQFSGCVLCCGKSSCFFCNCCCGRGCVFVVGMDFLCPLTAFLNSAPWSCRCICAPAALSWVRPLLGRWRSARGRRRRVPR